MKIDEISKRANTLLNSVKLTSNNSSLDIPRVVDHVLNGASDVIRGANLPLEISQLLQEQFRMQMIMLNTTLISNISKTKHEASMAPVRNIRSG
ncbi:MAG: hypothetical protein NZO16_04510 [Deltaproteobacteria bacterium]|nr:hypothetical protein [Deltaproteobacteria bacterium]